MCPNPRVGGRFSLPTDEALQRIRRVVSAGFRRVVLTGGEPTVHPGFRSVLQTMVDLGVCWDVITNGGAFSRMSLAREARAAGLRRAIVSLHSHRAEVAAEITGTRTRTHFRHLQAIHRLLDAGVQVIVSHVLLPQNHELLRGFIRFCAPEFGPSVQVKLSLPLFDLNGRDSARFRHRYAEYTDAIEHARQEAVRTRVPLLFESIPNCIHGEAMVANAGRSTLGITHNLDDREGRRVLSVAAIEAHTSVYAEPCLRCLAFRPTPCPEAMAERLVASD